jgi:hypothetical protein
VRRQSRGVRASMMVPQLQQSAKHSKTREKQRKDASSDNANGENEEEQIVLEKLSSLKLDNIHSDAKEYLLDIYQGQIEQQLVEVQPVYQSYLQLDLEKYPVEKLNENLNTLYFDEMMLCRNLVWKGYQSQGYIGRTCLFVIDRLIQTLACSFALKNLQTQN